MVHPAGAISSDIYAVAPGALGGTVLMPGSLHAAMFNGAGGWTDLGMSAALLGMDQTHQVGLFGVGAALWAGSAQNRVDLHPAGATSSRALAVAGNQQVGWTSISGGPSRAALWTGTAASHVSLHPPGADSSTAYATDGTFQWGGAGFTGPNGPYGRALRWSGTATSTVDFTPPGAIGAAVLGIGGGQQVGSVSMAQLQTHAVLWNGTPESWLNVHPFPGPGKSQLLATTGTVQVGWSHVPGFSFPHAGAWFGSAQSFVDLTQFLPAGYGGSRARRAWWRSGGSRMSGGT